MGRDIFIGLGALVMLGGLAWIYYGLREVASLLKSKGNDKGWKLLFLIIEESIFEIRTVFPLSMIGVGAVMLMYGLGFV